MKLALISDTHQQHDGMRYPIPECDVLIHAGDLTEPDPCQVCQVRESGGWLTSWPAKHVIFVPGNHDMLFQKVFARESRAAMEEFGVHVLIDEGVEIDGLKFWGSPWTPKFFNWYFMKDRGPDIARYWREIPSDTDVLITHGPPASILDISAFGFHHVGCEDLLREVIDRVRPRVHVFGHIHHSYGETIFVHGLHVGGIDPEKATRFVNAAICNETYDPVRRPVEVDL